MKIGDSTLLAVLIGVPASILVASYGYLAWEHGTLWLFDRVVHEGGKHTFLGTVFYFEHFLREIPIDLLMALGVTGWWHSVEGKVARGRRFESDSTLAAVILVGFAIAWSVVAHGWDQVRLDLFQYRTRDDLVAFGSHWHSHWLHLAFTLPAAAIFPLIRAGLGSHRDRRADRVDANRTEANKNEANRNEANKSNVPESAAHMSDRTGMDTSKPGVIMIGAWIVLFAGLTAIFGLSPASFTDPRYLGHQAREIATHALLTMPLAWAALLMRSRRRHSPVSEMDATSRHSARDVTAGARKHPLFYALIATAVAASIPLWITWKLRGVDVLAVAAKQSSYADLLASHAFEHTLDYVLVVLLVLAIGGKSYARASSVNPIVVDCDR